MDRAFHTHTAAADMAAKQEIFDLLLPNGGSMTRSATLQAADSQEKGLKAIDQQVETKV